jgi:hypothetical protein
MDGFGDTSTATISLRQIETYETEGYESNINAVDFCKSLACVR